MICESEPKLGQIVQEALKEGSLEKEDHVLQLWLVVHRALQKESPYAPYIQSLPQGSELPVNYSESLLRELTGTEALVAVQVTPPFNGTCSQSMSGCFCRRHLMPLTT